MTDHLDDIAISQSSQPEIMQQFYPPRAWRNPEERLAKAVLLRAIEDAKAGARDAIAWINARRERHAFDFETVCETLGLSPSATRKALKLAPARKLRPVNRFGTGVIGPIVVTEQQRHKYDHDYICQIHCQGCRNRYALSWKRARRIAKDARKKSWKSARR